MSIRRLFDRITTRGYKKKYEKMRQRCSRLQEKSRRERKELLRELSKVNFYRYGSYSPGIADWQARWDSSPGARVLLCAFRDYSGSLWKWTEALNRHTKFAARLVVFDLAAFGYRRDLVMPMLNFLGTEGLDELCNDADVIHIKDEDRMFTGSGGMSLQMFQKHAKPMVFTHYGGYARKFRDDSQYRAYVRKNFDARVAMTPDLNFDWFEGLYIPHAVDTMSYFYSWTDGRRLAHSPSTADRKGTSDLLAAIEALDIEFDLISGVPHEECLRRKQLANLFFDQAGQERAERLGISCVIGWYGNSALEAAVHGIPTLAHLSEQAFQGAARAGKDIRERCAIINTPLGRDGIRTTLERYFALSADDRVSISLATRRWVEEFHSYEACARELANVYERLLPVSARATAAA